MKILILLLIIKIFFSFSLSYGNESILQIMSQIEGFLEEENPVKAKTMLNELKNLIKIDTTAIKFFEGKIEFYLGNYKKVEELYNLIKKEEDFSSLSQRVKEFIEFALNASKIASNFISQESDHFIFRFKEGKDKILVEQGLLALENAYRNIGKDLNFFPEEKVIVEVYPTYQDFIQVSTLTKEEVENTGTIAICKFNRIMITTPRAMLRGYSWLDTLSHEYVHYILIKKTRNKTPVWLHEGIAKFEESRWRLQREEPLSPISKSMLAEALEKNYFIPFEKMHPSLAKLKSQEDAQLAFAEVVTVVEYLFSLGGYPLINEILLSIKNGIDPLKAISAGISMPITDLMELFKSYLKSKNYQLIEGAIFLKNEFKKESDKKEDEEEISENKIGSKKGYELTRLGDLLKKQNRIKAAIIEYSKAINEEKIKSPILYNKLATSYMMIKDYTQAEKILKESLNLYPEFVTTIVNLGEVSLLQGNNEQAIAYFEKSKEINPFNPIIYSYLTELYKKLGNNEESNKNDTTLKILLSF